MIVFQSEMAECHKHSIKDRTMRIWLFTLLGLLSLQASAGGYLVRETAKATDDFCTGNRWVLVGSGPRSTVVLHKWTYHFISQTREDEDITFRDFGEGNRETLDCEHNHTTWGNIAWDVVYTVKQG